MKGAVLRSAAAAVLSAAAAAFPQTAQCGIAVTFPAQGAKLPCIEKCHCIGAVEPGARLEINGTEIKPYRTGAFIAMLGTTPGATNTLVFVSGDERLERSFFVSGPQEKAATPPPAPVSDPDADERVEKPWRAYKAKANVFMNRVRSLPGDGESLAFLPEGFTVQGAPMKDGKNAAIWIDGRFAFIDSSRIAECGGDLPDRSKAAPDISEGFPEKPSGKPAGSIKILIDPGHGKSDTGTRSPHGWCEKDANLAQAKAIRDELAKAGFDTVMTREDDSFPALYDRPLQAYSMHADAFISIHHNANPPQSDPRTARHTVAYASNGRGLELAKAIQKHVAAALPGVKNKGAQTASYAVCRNPAVPSCLLEIDFLNLPEGEEAVFFDTERRERVAKAVVRGVKDWAGLE